MELADGVLAYVEQIQRSYERAVLALRVESELDRDEVAARARGAISGLVRGGEIFWSVDTEPAGVIVRQWGCAPDIGATLAALSRRSTRAGSRGGWLCMRPTGAPRTRPF